MFDCFGAGTCTKRKHEGIPLVKVTALADLNSECHWQKKYRSAPRIPLSQLKIVQASDVLPIAMWSSGCV